MDDEVIITVCYLSQHVEIESSEHESVTLVDTNNVTWEHEMVLIVLVVQHVNSIILYVSEC